MENEDAFAAEAHDEARLSRRRGRTGGDLEITRARRSSSDESPIGERLSEDEESSLLPSKSARARTTAAVDEEHSSYQRAINEPWLGAQGSEGLPWYKKPSVCSCRGEGQARLGADVETCRSSGCCPPSSHFFWPSVASLSPEPISSWT